MSAEIIPFGRITEVQRFERQLARNAEKLDLCRDDPMGVVREGQAARTTEPAPRAKAAEPPLSAEVINLSTHAPEPTTPARFVRAVFAGGWDAAMTEMESRRRRQHQAAADSEPMEEWKLAAACRAQELLGRAETHMVNEEWIAACHAINAAREAVMNIACHISPEHDAREKEVRRRRMEAAERGAATRRRNKEAREAGTTPPAAG